MVYLNSISRNQSANTLILNTQPLQYSIYSVLNFSVAPMIGNWSICISRIFYGYWIQIQSRTTLKILRGTTLEVSIGTISDGRKFECKFGYQTRFLIHCSIDKITNILRYGPCYLLKYPQLRYYIFKYY